MSLRKSLALFAVLALFAIPGSALAGSDEDARAGNAVRVLTEIQAIPEDAIPDRMLDTAHAIVVVPDSIKAGLVIGARRGHGLLSVKRPDGTWSNPAFVTLTGGSIGLQAGVQSSDIVLVFSSPRGVESIVNGKITLGADAGVAAGPVGRSAALATDGELKAEIWSWSRSRGLFAGVALDGAVLSIDDEANQDVYGAGTTPRMIFENRFAQRPSNAVVSFRDALEEATAAAAAARSEGTTPTARPAATATTATEATLPATTVVPGEAGTAAPEPSPFQPVDDQVEQNPATIEPLP